MEDLAKLYNDPKTGYVGLEELYRKSKQKGLPYTYREVKKWYNEQPVNQIYKIPQKIKKYNKIVSHRVQPGSFQADLMDLKKYSQWNKGYKYLLNIIDIYSRYAWSFPIKQKTPEQIKELIRKVMNEVNPSDIWITFDKGSEFKGSVKKLLDDRGAKIHLNDPDSIHSHNTVGMIE